MLTVVYFNYDPNDNNITEEHIHIWLQYYSACNFPHYVEVKKKWHSNFRKQFPMYNVELTRESHFSWEEHPTQYLELKATDILVHMTFPEINHEAELTVIPLLKGVPIGSLDRVARLFYVPVAQKYKYTTFEIPDFIKYCHYNHSGYATNGLQKSHGLGHSETLCLSLEVSKVANPTQYYETTAAVQATLDRVTDYKQTGLTVITYPLNVMVDMDRQYGIIWHPKCACTAIMEMYCRLHGREFNQDANNKLSASFLFPEMRQHDYLEHFKYIEFVRHPWGRFLSVYFDKHVFKNEGAYLQREGYQKYLEQYPQDRLVEFAAYMGTGAYVSEHFTPMKTTIRDGSRTTGLAAIERHSIETGVNEPLIAFLSCYHSAQVLEKAEIGTHRSNGLYSKMFCATQPMPIQFIEEIHEWSAEDWNRSAKEYAIEYNVILKNKVIREAMERLYPNHR